MNAINNTEYEYIVVGSGAGGGTIAARLAEQGKKVLVLEAGSDPKQLQGDDKAFPGEKRLPQDYEVPVFHTFASENSAISWDYFVRHYADLATQEKDDKFIRAEDGVLYPRTGALGGCTAHNAMISVYPHNADWDDIVQLTGDASWSATQMRQYFENFETCQYRPILRFWAKLGFNPSKHGWNGWFQTEAALPLQALAKDKILILSVIESALKAAEALPNLLARLKWFFTGLGDPNDWRLVQKNATGLHFTPLATKHGKRHSTRERLLDVQAAHPDYLTIELDALVSKVIIDKNRRAIGVEYLKGEKLYRAHSNPSQMPGKPNQVFASQEVILSGGAFNTPQLLMLSGIGPKAELDKHAIPVVLDLPGVGANLQDRYEVGVVNRMQKNWEVLEGVTYSSDDPQYQEWQNKHKGVYTTNGAVLAVIKRSLAEQPLPDLFCFAVLGKFKGYFPGYSKLIRDDLNYLTWAILKAHTLNRAGEVKLSSADPRDRPYINFRYFEEGSDSQGKDLDAVLEGIKFVRKITRPLIEQGILTEELPGPALQSDTELRDFIRNNAWGHHASCTCPIGSDSDPLAVLDSDFRVRGIKGLRVVDASVFPKIPGFFIVTSIYLIAEKAADVILKQNHGH
ncbi:GMC family oxidoreductase [Methylomonas sp. AM2-LC]|uniref:GMC family oxidoreductase n=1 Tax=Methylomonas sp. AM2-LC TaxID=3153301 RepID=UPI0032673F7C